MPRIKQKSYLYSNRLSAQHLAKDSTLNKVERIIYKKGKKEIEISEEKVGERQFMILQNLGAVLASYTNKHIGYIESLLLNCNEAMANDDSEIEFHFQQGMRIPYNVLIATPQEIIVLSQVIEQIITRTEEKYPSDFMTLGKPKMEEIELLLWDKGEDK